MLRGRCLTASPRSTNTMSNTSKTVFVSAIVALAISLVVFFVAPKQAVQFGGDISNALKTFNQGINVGTGNNFTVDSNGRTTNGGSVVTIASASLHYTASQICSNSVINRTLTGNVAGFVGTPASVSNDTLPTAASIISGCLTNSGQYTDVYFRNLSRDAGEKITFVTNTGIDILVASGSKSTLQSNGNQKQRALVRFTNVDGASVSAQFIQFGK